MIVKKWGYKLWISEKESKSVVIHAENVHAVLKEFMREEL